VALGGHVRLRCELFAESSELYHRLIKFHQFAIAPHQHLFSFSFSLLDAVYSPSIALIKYELSFDFYSLIKYEFSFDFYSLIKYKFSFDFYSHCLCTPQMENPDLRSASRMQVKALVTSSLITSC